ncbi:unnamed protein product [Rhizoctonia solani]|uniref:Uncharacterized protein n=1 Tax=Rhizoctonia solani TaxID=456999 RepID=A0A8H2Y5F6_9AGAM|nr:unnamed protein product [Rhizoctonia solani]
MDKHLGNMQTSINDMQPTMNDMQPIMNDMQPTMNNMQPTMNDTKASINNMQAYVDNRLERAERRTTEQFEALEDRLTEIDSHITRGFNDANYRLDIQQCRALLAKAKTHNLTVSDDNFLLHPPATTQCQYAWQSIPSYC